MTQDEKDEKAYAGALVVPRAQLGAEEFQFGVVFSPVPPHKGRLVAVGTGGPFVNKLDAEGALPAAFTQTTVAVLARTFAIVVPDALRADGVGVTYSFST